MSAPTPSAIPTLQLADREQLRLSLRPGLNKASFSNWLHRAIKEHGFPSPIRMGGRSVAWSVVSVTQWLEGRPRSGVFSGRRRGRSR